MTVLKVGAREHVCRPGWEVRDGWFYSLHLPAGSVVECECGTVWLAVALKPWEEPGLVMDRVQWRKETRRERRRRVRSR